MFTILIYERDLEGPADVQTFDTLESATKAAKFETEWETCASVEVHDPDGHIVAIHEGEFV